MIVYCHWELYFYESNFTYTAPIHAVFPLFSHAPSDYSLSMSDILENPMTLLISIFILQKGTFM